MAGIDQLIRDIDAYQARLRNAEQAIVSEMADVVETDMNARLSAVTDPDGNVDAHVNRVVNGNNAIISLTGSQAAYLEFGTGIIGRSSPHQMAGQFGWDYATGSKIRTFRNGRIGWVYFDTSRNHYRITSGIAAQNIVIGAADTARRNIYRVTRRALQ